MNIKNKIWVSVLSILLFFVQTVPATAVQEQTYRITILTEPKNAKVQVELFGMLSEYVFGAKLPQGRFHIIVSHPGYVTENGYIEILNKDWAGKVVLQSISDSVPVATDDAQRRKLTKEKTLLAAEKQKLEKMYQQLMQEKQNLKQSNIKLEQKLQQLTNTKKTPAFKASITAPKRRKSQNAQLERFPAIRTVTANVDAEALDITDLQSFVASNNQPFDTAQKIMLKKLQKLPSKKNASVLDVDDLIKLRQILADNPNDKVSKKLLSFHRSRYMVFVGIYPLKSDRLKDIEKKLQQYGLPTFYQDIDLKGKASLRLCVGLFEKRNEAVAAQKLIRDRFNIRNSIIRRYGTKS